MADPHNKKRYGEEWPTWRIDAIQEIWIIKPWVILSGGWAWHFLSPEGHKELKHAHDHKDFDIFVSPENVVPVVPMLKEHGFEIVPTRFPPGEDDFRRFEKIVDGRKLTIDMFVREVPNRMVREGWRVVEPQYLLGLYGNIHSSDKCFAVVAAKKLIDQGTDPEGRPELVEIPHEIS